MVPYVLGPGAAPLGLALADMNGDGRLDLLTASDPQVGLLLGRSDGTLGLVGLFPTGGTGAVALKVGDINRDGRPDVVMAGPGAAGLLLGMPNGTLTPPMGRFPLNMTANPGALALGDVNGDGRLDIVTAYASTTTSGAFDQAIVLLGRASNAFAPAVAYPLPPGSRPEAVALGDLNGDGWLDIATANGNAGTVGLLFGQGNGTFSSATSIAMGAGAGPLGVVVGDVNGDGQPDLLTANNGLASVDVRLNTGGGTFGPVATYPVSAAPVGITLGDVNNDGYPDVVTAGFGSDQLSVLLGTGRGIFGPVTSYSTGAGSSPISAAIGDVNGDGAPDLVSANFSAATAGVLLSQAPVLTLTGPTSGRAGAPVTLAGTRLAGATAVTFSSSTQVVATVPASSFSSFNYTATPNTIGLVVPASLAAGTYNVAVVTPHGSSPAVSFGVSAPLAMGRELAAELVAVFPSPAHASALVQVPAVAGITVVSLRLCDALGRPVRTLDAALPPTGLRQDLDLRGLVPGLYVVQVRAGTALVTRRLLVN